MFIVGDAHQRIYKNKVTLSKCGINIRGRSSRLRINYRTTEEIRQYAFGLLRGIPFDDLDTESDIGDTRSEEHTSELQSLMRISYAVFCLKKKIYTHKSD